MKRLGLIAALSMMLVGFSASAASAVTTTTIIPANAPTGTHLQTGTIGCTVTGTVVSCSSFELAGVGNADAEATLVATYTATVDCRNRGGNIVEVKAQVIAAPSSTGTIEAKNGRLLVPVLTSAPAPTAAQFEAAAVCPNPNWTKVTRTETIALTSFTYKLTFEGFTAPYITITGP